MQDRSSDETDVAKADEGQSQTTPDETRPGARRQAYLEERAKKSQQSVREVVVRPTAGKARGRSRHIVILLSFLIVVIAPPVLAGWYLYTVAKDQYASTVGFSVRKEEMNSPIEILGGITSLSGSSSSDSDILYEYIQSQELVQEVDAELDLRTLYNQSADPVFSLSADASTEDLVEYWSRMVKIFYDTSTQLIELRVTAFEPETAQRVAQVIFDKSSDMINELSAIARNDATQYASEELERAVERLKEARQALTEYRSVTQIVDPTADVQGQVGLLSSLQAQQAEALIELALLRDTAQAGDPRITQAQRKIDVIAEQIEDERRKLGASSESDESYAQIVGEYERLIVDREFAETAYTAALSAYDAAQSEAQRKSRYLAAYIKPTLAQEARFPQRLVLTGLVALFAFLAWAMMVLIYYSIRDRR